MENPFLKQFSLRAQIPKFLLDMDNSSSLLPPPLLVDDEVDDDDSEMSLSLIGKLLFFSTFVFVFKAPDTLSSSKFKIRLLLGDLDWGTFVGGTGLLERSTCNESKNAAFQKRNECQIG